MPPKRKASSKKAPPQKTAPPQKKACDACYKRKGQCILENSDDPCQWCKNRGVECTFDREAPRKKRRSSDVQSLLQRVQTLESSLSACIAAEESSAISNRESTASRCDEESDPSHNSDSPPVHKQRSDSEIASRAKSRQRELSQYTCRWGPNWYFNGIAISSEAGLEWISQRTGQPVSPADFSIHIEELSAGLPGDSLPLTALCELPNKTVVLDVLKAYIESSFRLAYPVFDEIMFKRQVEKAYEPQKGPHYSTAQVSAKLCVFSMLALKSHLNAPRICLPEDEDIYAAKAHYLLESIKSDGTYPTLEAAIVLQILSMLRGHWHGASSYGLIAFLIIRELGGTRDLRPIIVGMPDIEAFRNWQHMQLLFWISFIIDKNVALFTGRPPYLAEIYCDLAVPVNYLPWEEFQSCAHIIDRETGTLKALPPKPSQFFRAHLPGDLEISPLKEEVYKRLFSRAANRAKNNQLLQHIREIDELIEDWRLSFREEYRPVLSVSDETLPNEAGGDVPIMIRRTALQLEYLHLMTVTHTTVRKCKDATSENSPNLHSVVHSSFDISLEASRSIIRCLKFLIDRVGQGAFQYVTSYAHVAALTLFLNIVIHPLDHRSRDDLEVLTSTGNMIRKMPMLELTKAEIIHLRELNKFVTRLFWLGSSAVVKADKESDQTEQALV